MAERPTGTVTFLFTDVEGSTARWERHSAWMAAAHARHEAILREAIAAHGGWAYKQIGDAFQAAFQTAPAALAAAVAAQQALAGESWGEPGPLRVRMALHSGTAEERADDYVGPLLNRVARLLVAGHGGQILLTAAAYELVRDHLPAAVELRDLGERRLKDLARPEHIWEAWEPSAPRDFPPLKTLDWRPNNLPRQPTALIGRERETAAIAALLRRPDVGLVTVTGPGGAGKTRMALQIAADVLDDFPAGVWFVDLAPIRDPALALGAVAAVLDIREVPGQPLLATLIAALQGRRLLLLLDNFEQVSAAAPAVGQLLAGAPDLTVLVTSRVPLRLRGEREVAAPPLAVPRPPLPALAQLGQYEAVRLFVERAVTVKPDFAVTNANAPAVAEICARLDGLPLAIELAAARVRLLSPEALLGRLSSRLTVLTGGAADLPARQHTLRSTIAWSYDLLDAAEQQLFRRLAVFRGGRSLEAIEAVCNAAGDLQIDLLDGVDSLITKSLLRQQAGAGGEQRFVMLETIHEFAAEALDLSGEGAAVRAAHLAFFLGLAEEAEPALRGPTPMPALARLDEEHDNLRAALDWAGATGRLAEALRLAGALGYYWLVQGHFREGRERLTALLAAGRGLGAEPSAKALLWLAPLTWRGGAYAAGEALLQESLTLYRSLGDERGAGRVLTEIGDIFLETGILDRGHEFLAQGLALGREAGDELGIARALNDLGELARSRGDYPTARSLYEESLLHAREVGDKWSLFAPLLNIAVVADRPRATGPAAAYLAEALQLCLEMKDKRAASACLGVGFADLALEQARPKRAARLLGASDALLASLGIPWEATDGRDHRALIMTAQTQLGTTAYAAAYAAGQAMSLEEAVAYALAEGPPDA
jgi:predicted ATPase/class 3 adenylate cyclase